MSESSMIDPFGPLELAPGNSSMVTLGELSLEFVRRPEEIHLRSWMADGGPDDESWVRWAVGQDEDVRLEPATPDRLVVVSPEHSFHLPPKARARIYLRLPVFLKMVVRSSSGAVSVIADLPSLVLSDTWWGDPTEGELAYWITTKARRELSADLFVPYFAMSALALENGSAEPLPVERFAVRVPHLGLFDADGRLWTGETRVRYESVSEGSRIRFTGRPPAEAGAAVQVAPARDPQSRGFHARTFQRLKSFSHLGI